MLSSSLRNRWYERRFASPGGEKKRRVEFLAPLGLDVVVTEGGVVQPVATGQGLDMARIARKAAQGIVNAEVAVIAGKDRAGLLASQIVLDDFVDRIAWSLTHGTSLTPTTPVADRYFQVGLNRNGSLPTLVQNGIIQQAKKSFEDHPESLTVIPEFGAIEVPMVNQLLEVAKDHGAKVLLRLSTEVGRMGFKARALAAKADCIVLSNLQLRALATSAGSTVEAVDRLRQGGLDKPVIIVQDGVRAILAHDQQGWYHHPAYVTDAPRSAREELDAIAAIVACQWQMGLVTGGDVREVLRIAAGAAAMHSMALPIHGMRSIGEFCADASPRAWADENDGPPRSIIPLPPPETPREETSQPPQATRREFFKTSLAGILAAIHRFIRE